MTLVGNLQPYLFNAVLKVPIGEQGSLGGSLASFNELVFLAVASLVGAASDKVGRAPDLRPRLRRHVVRLLPLPARDGARRSLSLPGRVRGRRGLRRRRCSPRSSRTTQWSPRAAASSASASSSTASASRRWWCSAGRLPRMIEAMGVEPVQAAKCAYWSVAALCFLPFLIVAFGLQPGAPAASSARNRCSRRCASGSAAARDPRVLLAYLLGDGLARRPRGALHVLPAVVDDLRHRRGPVGRGGPGRRHEVLRHRAGRRHALGAGRDLLHRPARPRARAGDRDGARVAPPTSPSAWSTIRWARRCMPRQRSWASAR